MIDFSVDAKGKCKNCPYMELEVEAHNLCLEGKIAVRALHQHLYQDLYPTMAHANWD